MRLQLWGLVVVSVGVSTLVGACASQTNSASSLQGRVWFCQGVDAGHPSGSLATVEVARDAATLATAKIQVPGVADVQISPGQFVVRVDGQPSLTSEVADSGTTSAHAGSGCPAAP
jgi:hypothetical protein